MSIGDNIRNMRLSKGMSQEELGLKLGVSSNAVSRWENGVCKPSKRSLSAIAMVLGIEFDIFTINEIANSICHEKYVRLLGAFHKLSDRNKLKVVLYAERKKELQYE